MLNTKIISARNVNQALAKGLWHLLDNGIVSDSRNGRVLRARGPVITEYERPQERVLFSPLRDANPFFHLMECIWMLGGGRDVATPARFAKQIAAYSDDGETLNGAYGHRWRYHFGYDQIMTVITELLGNPFSRRCVVAMWDAQNVGGYVGDLQAATQGSKDVPCNTHIYFDFVEGALNMTVCCRSNDAVWGAYGANAVHFSFLQEFVADAIGAQVGKLYQLSNNFHVYVDRPDVQRLFCKGDSIAKLGLSTAYVPVDHYSELQPSTPLLLGLNGQRPTSAQVAGFLAEAEMFFEHSEEDDRAPFFKHVARPVLLAHDAYKAGDIQLARNHLTNCRAADWRLACEEWIGRRVAARALIQEKLNG